MISRQKPKLTHIPFSKDWVLYEDKHILVVNKPSGLLSVPGKDVPAERNLLAQVATHYPDAMIVHRLDMDTSGIMVLARNKASHRSLSIQFQDRLTHKRYHAVCAGKPSQTEGIINLPMRCDWENRPLQMVDCKQGKHASTQWQINQQKQTCFLVCLTPITGRSHQLRLHMKMLGHPILGDNLYADPISLKQANRLLLHASHLRFTHPTTQKKMAFDCAHAFQF